MNDLATTAIKNNCPQTLIVLFFGSDTSTTQCTHTPVFDLPVVPLNRKSRAFKGGQSPYFRSVSQVAKTALGLKSKRVNKVSTTYSLLMHTEKVSRKNSTAIKCIFAGIFFFQVWIVPPNLSKLSCYTYRIVSLRFLLMIHLQENFFIFQGFIFWRKGKIIFFCNYTPQDFSMLLPVPTAIIKRLR